MLTGSARTWLNSLPADNINAWVDFEEALVRNFTGTYKRPGGPCELAMCVQAADKPFCDYLTRWIELRNSCEGVHMCVQAADKPFRPSNTSSRVKLMAKADKYATADFVMRIKVTATGKATPPPATPRPVAKSRQQQNNKRKTDQPDPRYGNKQVATIEEEQPAAQASSQRQRAGKGTWQPKLTFEQMLDAPCKMHFGAKPATRTLQQCSFSQRLARGEGLPTAPPPAQVSAPASVSAPAPPNDGRLRDQFLG
ncbi:endoglucanase 3 [Hordeum vulgare]|nr:endoglucanase 3 [Hordeum vulgare]